MGFIKYIRVDCNSFSRLSAALKIIFSISLLVLPIFEDFRIRIDIIFTNSIHNLNPGLTSFHLQSTIVVIIEPIKELCNEIIAGNF